MTAQSTLPSKQSRGNMVSYKVRAIAVIVILSGLLSISIAFGFNIGTMTIPLVFGAIFYLFSKDYPRSLPENSAHKQVDEDIFRNLPVAMVETDNYGKVIRVNGAALALLGQTTLLDQMLTDIVEGMGKSISDRLSDTIKGFGLGRPEMARCLKNSEEIFVQLTMSRMQHDQKTTILCVISDATELKTLEAQFVQSQKMQAVGQLAGGIAHDFNNILTAITGHADLLLHRMDITDSSYDDLSQIKQNSNRAAALIRQLLAFSRKQTLQPKALHIDDTLSELSHLLNRLLGEKVQLSTEHGVDLRPIRADERQLEQVIVNLVVNARDSMPEGGVVVIRTKNVSLQEELFRDRATVHPGDYVVIEVIDSGTGIPKDKIGKIFEPFFTTKKVGEGTGLGLSTVYGIIKQSGGFVFVDSEVDVGSRFTIYLPVEDIVEVEQKKVAPLEDQPDQTGRGRILLVEDEAPVRAFAARALALRGYFVIEAASGEEALEILNDCDNEFDLLVSDVVMPGKDGPTWVKEALKINPLVKVIFVSGYAEGSVGENVNDIPNSLFLAKPFSLVELTQKVKEQIDA